MAITAANARKQYAKLSATQRARYAKGATNSRTKGMSNAARHAKGMKAAGSSGG